jgi:hypothetical protein
MTMRRCEERDPHKVPARCLAALIVALALGAPTAIAADPSDRTASSPYRSSSLLRKRPPEWMGENFHYKKGCGLEYRRELKAGDRPLELGIAGPVLRKKKSVGLAFEVRF